MAGLDDCLELRGLWKESESKTTPKFLTLGNKPVLGQFEF